MATKKATSKLKKPAKKVAKKPLKKATRKSATAKSLLGKPAPDFSMPTGDGGTVRLKDLRGRRIVLYFYPKDDTPGCTTQACAFRDGMPNFAKTNAVVIGVSKDSVASHQKFKNKYNLNFPLASDDSKVAEAFGVWGEKSLYGRTFMGVIRSTFIIDETGIVRAEWRKVSVAGHADEVRKALGVL